MAKNTMPEKKNVGVATEKKPPQKLNKGGLMDKKKKAKASDLKPRKYM